MEDLKKSNHLGESLWDAVRDFIAFFSFIRLCKEFNTFFVFIKLSCCKYKTFAHST